MIFALYFIILILIILLIYLDIKKIINITAKWLTLFLLIFLPNMVIINYLILRQQSPDYNHVIPVVEFIFFCTYFGLKINIFPFYDKQPISRRLRALMGGRKLVLYSLYTVIIQSIIYFSSHNLLSIYKIPTHVIIINIIIMALIITTMYLNGMLRIVIISSRLNIFKKYIIISLMLIPIINLFIILYACSVVKAEYEHESYKVINNNMRITSEICKTKYPLVLIHGLGFKDYKYVNYWGRIPKELIRNGASVYYGNQEAWGTIEQNAMDIKNKILEVIEKEKCEKVNLIAHSKGGLDARYMVSALNMEKYVASLTMIATPHKGSRLIDIIYKIPKGILHIISSFINKYFKIIGDKNPDFFTASKQLSEEYSESFNKEVINCENVYYQSYATVMKHFLSDYILSIPYIMLRIIDEKNDGMVTIKSAKWGEFKGTLSNKYSRGISHGDIIDLRKNDYKGFDVREKYVEIVAELKSSGY